MIFIKEYIDYSRSDLLKMEVDKFFLLVENAKQRQQIKEKAHRERERKRG